MLLKATLCYSSPFSSLFSIFMTTKLHTVATTRLSPTIILVGWTSQQKIITVGVTESRETINRDWCCHTLYCRYVDPASPWSTALNYSPYNSFGSTGLAGRGLYSCPTQQVCAYHPSYHADAAGSVGGGDVKPTSFCVPAWSINSLALSVS